MSETSKPKKQQLTSSVLDDESAPYWQGCEEGELRLQQCDQCERWQFYPRCICMHCGSISLTWRVASGRAELLSFSVVHRSYGEFATKVPYVVALVQLNEGPNMVSNVVDCEFGDLAIGMRLSVEFQRRETGTMVPVFVPESIAK